MFFSHLNMIRIWNRILALSGVEVNYSEGFNKTRKLGFSSPTRVGVESNCEYITLATSEEAETVVAKIENNLPDWLQIEYAKAVDKINIASINTAAEYFITFDDYKSCKAKINNFFKRDSIQINIVLHGEHKTLEVRDRIKSYTLLEEGFNMLAGVGDKSVRIDEFVKTMLEAIGKSVNDYSIIKTNLFAVKEDELVNIDQIIK